MVNCKFVLPASSLIWKEITTAMQLRVFTVLAACGYAKKTKPTVPHLQADELCVNDYYGDQLSVTGCSSTGATAGIVIIPPDPITDDEDEESLRSSVIDKRVKRLNINYDRDAHVTTWQRHDHHYC